MYTLNFLIQHQSIVETVTNVIFHELFHQITGWRCIMVEVSGGKLLSQKAQVPVPLSSSFQDFAVDERNYRGIIFRIQRLYIW